MPVGQLLQFMAELMVFILADFAVFFRLFQGIHAVAANIANRDARGFGIFVGELDEFLAAFLVQFRQRDADELAVRLRVEAEPGFTDRLIHRLDQPLVPDLNRDQTGLRRADCANLVDWRDVSVGFDLYRIEQCGGGAAGAQPIQFTFHRGNRAVHAATEFVLVVAHDRSSARAGCYARSSIIVQRPSPRSTAASAPRS